jgi:hypothetical protein
LKNHQAISSTRLRSSVDDKDLRPTERLAAVVHWQNLPTDSNRPFDALDQLYTQILSYVPGRSRLILILTAINGFQDLDVGDIEQLLGLNPCDVRLSFRRLHSIFNVPANGDISMYHASIQDFLDDPTRSGEFCVSTLQRRMELARSILKALSRTSDDSIDQSSLKHIDEYAATFQEISSNNCLTNYLICRWLADRGIQYVGSSVPPPADLVPLIRSMNPECLFHLDNVSEVTTHVDRTLRLRPSRTSLV